MMKKNVLTVVLAIASVASLVAGCGSPENGSSVASTDGGPSAVEEMGTDQGSEASNNSDSVSTKDSSEISGKITIVQCEGNDKPGLITLMDNFKKAYPNVEIESTYMVNSELKKNMQIAMLADDLPDILTFDSPDFAYFAANGYFMDITDDLNRWGELDNFYQGPLDSVTYNDRIYGLPWYSNDLAIFYNKDMLDAAGIEPPTTWSELKTAAATLTNNGVYGFGMALPASEVGTYQYIPWLYSAGGNISDLSSEAAKESLSFIKGMVDDGSMSKEVINWAHGDLQTAFLGQQVAMIEFGTWGLGASLADAEFNWGVVPIPTNDETGKSISVLGGYDLGITKDCKNYDAALAFLEFAMSGDQVLAYAKSVGNLPVRKDVAEDPFYQEEKMKVFVDEMDDAVSRVNPFWPELSLNVYTAIQKAVTGEESINDALTEANDANAAYWTVGK